MQHGHTLFWFTIFLGFIFVKNLWRKSIHLYILYARGLVNLLLCTTAGKHASPHHLTTLLLSSCSWGDNGTCLQRVSLVSFSTRQHKPGVTQSCCSAQSRRQTEGVKGCSGCQLSQPGIDVQCFWAVSSGAAVIAAGRMQLSRTQVQFVWKTQFRFWFLKFRTIQKSKTIW